MLAHVDTFDSEEQDEVDKPLDFSKIWFTPFKSLILSSDFSLNTEFIFFMLNS